MPTLLRSPYAIQKPPAGSQIDWGHPLTRGLVGLWAINEGSGRSLQDLTQHSGLAAFVNAPVWAAGYRGSVVQFDGVSSYVLAPYSPSHNCLSGVSIECWTDWGSANNRFVVSKPFAATHTSPFADYLLYRNAGGVAAFRIGATATDSATAPADNTLVHIVLTADGSNHRWYFNTKLDKTVALTDIPTNTNSRGVRIGANAGAGEVFNGSIFKVAIYDRALSQPEIRSLYDEPWGMLRGPDVWRRVYAPDPPSTATSFRHSGRQFANRAGSRSGF